jgi:carnitine 3-dehydrogenase / betainyl-CoA thioesterase
MAEPPGTVALLGGGVIGGGWAARFAICGIDVRLYDPDPNAERTVGEVLANARRAYGRLTLAPLPAEGTVTLVGTPEEAVQGAGFVQESAPEREPLKRELLARASRAAASDVIIASSTSGLLPTRLQADMAHPERLAVGHPFNPVYLLPLVELCGGEQTAPETLERAAAVYRAVGMRPLVLRKEIDAFVADRLLEALWREALWLVADDVATVEEVDDAIRFGAGLRWAFMGTFLTYRIAGGEAGMRHFMEQFGPALQLPWSKLTDVPELTDALLDKLVAQSDAQAAGRSIRDLERLRDDCLVSIMQGLRAHDFGAGAVLAGYERALFAAAPATPARDDEAPLRLHTAVVAPEWIDYNGHAHESRYLQVFGDTTDALLRHIGLDLDGARGGAVVHDDADPRPRREAPARLPLAPPHPGRRAVGHGRADAPARRCRDRSRPRGGARVARPHRADRRGACRTAAARARGPRRRDAARRGGIARSPGSGRDVQLCLGGALAHHAGDDRVRRRPCALVLGLPGGSGHLRHRGDEHLADHGIVLGPGAVGDVAGAELAQRRHDRVEVAQRIAQEDQRGEQHALLAAQIGAGEQRLRRRSGGEQPRVEDVHQLVASGGDQVEARFERFQIEVHAEQLPGLRAQLEER